MTTFWLLSSWTMKYLKPYRPFECSLHEVWIPSNQHSLSDCCPRGVWFLLEQLIFWMLSLWVSKLHAVWTDSFKTTCTLWLLIPNYLQEDDVVAGPSHLGKARTKKTSLKLQRVNPGGGAIKGRKVSEKKRKIGQVMAGSAPSVSNGGGSMENGLSLPQLDASSKPVDIMNNNNSLDAPVPLPSFSSLSSWNRSPT